MNELKFGLPNLREKKEEKYTNEGVLTFIPTGEGLGRKVVLNNKALEMLNIADTNNQISFSFSGPDIYIVNTSGVDNCSGLKIGKTTNGFTDKKHYDFIKSKSYNLKDEDTLELFLEETDNTFQENKVYKLTTIDNMSFMKGALSEEINQESVNEVEVVDEQLNA